MIIVDSVKTAVKAIPLQSVTTAVKAMPISEIVGKAVEPIRESVKHVAVSALSQNTLQTINENHWNNNKRKINNFYLFN